MEKILKNDEALFSLPDFKRMELMRFAARTRRCHTQMVIHHQSVGEHTFGALAILDLVEPDCSKEAWAALLYHDAPEAITGDVPAPAKWRFPNLENALKTAERTIAREHGVHTPISEAEERLIKYADIMELAWYGMEEMKMGNHGVASMVVAALRAVKERHLNRCNLRTHQFYEYSVTMFESLGGSSDAI